MHEAKIAEVIKDAFIESLRDKEESFRVRMYQRILDLDDGFFMFQGAAGFVSGEGILCLHANASIKKCSKENVTDILKKLTGIRYGVLNNDTDSDNDLKKHNLLFYYDDSNKELYAICPMKMALLFEEYEIAEKLFDMDYPNVTVNPFEFYKDVKISGNAAWFMKNERSTEAQEHIQFFNFKTVDLIDFFIGQDVPENLVNKILAMGCLENGFIGGDLFEKFTNGELSDEIKIRRLLKFSALPNGAGLEWRLGDFAKCVDLEHFDRYLYYQEYGNDYRKSNRAFKKLIDWTYAIQMELLDRVIKGGRSCDWKGLLDSGHGFFGPYICPGEYTRHLSQNPDVSIKMFSVGLKKRTKMLRLCVDYQPMFESAFVSTIKEYSEIRGLCTHMTDYMFDKDVEKINKILQGYGSLIKKYAAFKSPKKDYFKILKKHFLKPNFNCVLAVDEYKMQSDIYMSSRENILKYRNWKETVNLSVKSLNTINTVAEYIDRIWSARFTQDEWETNGGEAEAELDSLKAIQQSLAERFVDILSHFKFLPPTRGITKSLQNEIDRCINFAVGIGNEDLIIFLFGSGILPRESIKETKRKVIKEKRFNLLPAVIALQ